MASNRYGIYSASFNGTLDLTQLREQSLNLGSRYKVIRPGGALNPAAHLLSQANPVKRFFTSDLLTVLTNVDIVSGLACPSGAVMRYQERVPAGAFATGGAHVIQTCAKGFLHITSISVDIDGEQGAEAELEFVGLSADGTNPYTTSETTNFSTAPVPAYVSQYYMGGQWLGSTQVESLTSLRIAPGTNFAARRVDGGVFPRYGASSITSRDPVKEMTYLNVGLPTEMGSLFTNLLGSTVKSYFQRGTTAADGRLAVAATSHIRVDAATGTWAHDNIRVGNEDDATVSVMVRPTGVLAVSLGVAIP